MLSWLNEVCEMKRSILYLMVLFTMLFVSACAKTVSIEEYEKVVKERDDYFRRAMEEYPY